MLVVQCHLLVLRISVALLILSTTDLVELNLVFMADMLSADWILFIAEDY